MPHAAGARGFARSGGFLLHPFRAALLATVCVLPLMAPGGAWGQEAGAMAPGQAGVPAAGDVGAAAPDSAPDSAQVSAQVSAQDPAESPAAQAPAADLPAQAYVPPAPQPVPAAPTRLAAAQTPAPPPAPAADAAPPPPPPPALEPAAPAPAPAEAPPAAPGEAPPAAPAPPRHVSHHRAASARRAPAARAPLNQGDTIQAIKVTGNERIEEGTILSYMLVQPGDPFGGDRVDKSLRTLYATGLFADVNIRRQGDDLVVNVTENPLVNRITFEGNHNVKEDDLRKELQMKPRAVFSVRQAQADRQRMLNVYAGKGRFAASVTPELVRLPQNRVNVVFKVVEGPKTLISRIVFVGNHAFSGGQLQEVIDSRESRWWRFLSSSDEFNPSRVDFDRELLRRFYLAHGYADFDVTNLASELSADRKEFFVTFQIHEGQRYRIGKVTVKSTVPHLNADTYAPLVALSSGAYYNGDKVEKFTNLLEDRIRRDNYVFVKIDPRIRRDEKTHTVDLQFDIEQGPRVYVERIDINGNSVTRDNVIRREFRFAEGDPLDPTLTRITKIRLNDLGYFTDVKVTPQPGSAADKTVVDVDLVEKATGELSLGGGYSTTSGILGQAGLRQHNLIGTGIDAGINGTVAQYESQLDLSATDPYFLDRNLVAGSDLFFLNNNNQYVSDYQETRYGLSLRLGYAFNDHVSQAWTYSLIDRDVNNIQTYASQYVVDEAGWSLLSMIGQTMTFDWRDSRAATTKGFVLRVGTDFAGLGGDENYVRAKVDGTYWIPLEYFTGNPDWNVSLTGGAGELFNLQSKERIIDRFFLGGDNLRGFLDQGVGPHSVAYTQCLGTAPPDIATYGPLKGQCTTPGLFRGSDSLGGNTILTGSAELHFPLPLPADFGVTGRAFVDSGTLYGLNVPPNAQTDCLFTLPKNGKGETLDSHGSVISQCYYNSDAFRLSAGFGVSWKSPFGLINVDLGIPILKQPYDQLQIFRFGFGTRFQ
jgi:outer membrane protein insertion porin family